MDRGHKHGHGLPPLPLPPPFKGNNNIGEASKAAEATVDPETKNQDSQDFEEEAQRRKRVLANRQYSQKYRLKQLNHLIKLEREVKTFQAEIIISSSRVKHYYSHNSLMSAENYSLNQKLSALSDQLALKKAQFEELDMERQILRQLYIVNLQLQKQQELPQWEGSLIQGFDEICGNNNI